MCILGLSFVERLSSFGVSFIVFLLYRTAFWDPGKCFIEDILIYVVKGHQHNVVKGRQLYTLTCLNLKIKVLVHVQGGFTVLNSPYQFSSSSFSCPAHSPSPQHFEQRDPCSSRNAYTCKQIL